MSSEILHHVGLVRNNVSEEHIASIFMVTCLSVEMLREALFAVRREASSRCVLERFKIVVTLKMETICYSETSVLTISTRCNISKDIHHCYHRKHIAENCVLRPYILMNYCGL
jgi:hypothetical protein